MIDPPIFASPLAASRAFLREVATRVWAFEGTRIVDFDGPFVEWEEERARRVGPS